MKPAPDESIPEEIQAQAAYWVSRRDRGLTPAEQDEYIQWLRADPAHGRAVARYAAALQRLMLLYDWAPSHTEEPNENILAPARRRSWRGLVLAAACLALAAVAAWRMPGSSEPDAPPATAVNYLRVNERLALPDGSRVELKDGSRVHVEYSDRERVVRLEHGEAHFSVWKDASRPFVVRVGQVSVVAVGTAFNVRREDRNVEVLVTSGSVRLAALAPAAEQGAGAALPEIASPVGAELGAGERASVEVRANAPAGPFAPVISRVTHEEIAQALSWQTPRLEFRDTPLVLAIAQFNLLNKHQLVIGDADLADLRVGGSFRPDNVEAFVRLLELGFEVQGARRGEHETILRRRR
jgi:transmembrane sensor